jgi:hypothetical protein
VILSISLRASRSSFTVSAYQLTFPENFPSRLFRSWPAGARRAGRGSNGFQGKGPARRLGKRETYRQRKARLKAAGRDLSGERRLRRQERAQPVLAAAS